MNQARRTSTSLSVVSDDETASDRLVREHLDLARRLASRYVSRGVDLDDLVQVANLGLLKAARGFDEGRGAFPPYATATILGEIKKYFRDSGWVVRPPRRIQELQARIVSATAEHWQKFAQAPSADWLSGNLDVSVKDVREAQAASGCFTPKSLDTRTDEDSMTFGETIPDPNDSGLERVETMAAVIPLVRTLTPEDKELLTMRFIAEMTQQEIADRIGVSQMQVSRRLKRVLENLRAQLDHVPA